MDTMGRTWTHMPPGKTLEVVLVEVVTSEDMYRTETTVKLEVCKGDLVTTPSHPTRADRYIRPRS